MTKSVWMRVNLSRQMEILSVRLLADYSPMCPLLCWAAFFQIVGILIVGYDSGSPASARC